MNDIINDNENTFNKSKYKVKSEHGGPPILIIHIHTHLFDVNQCLYYL